MGDISTEPSMEDILSSIKRIIAEEGEAAVAERRRKPIARPAPPPAREEVLELSEPAPPPLPAAEPAPNLAAAEAAPQPLPAPSAPPAPAPSAPIVSPRAAEESRGQLEALSRMVVRPETPGADTLEGLVREMLKPMLSAWLDTHLPAMVEAMVAREIARIAGRDG